MRDCHEYIDLLTAQLDGEITEAEERELFEHLLACPECRMLQQDLLELSDTMSEMQLMPPADLTERIMTAVAAEKKANVIPFYKRRHFLSSAITAAAMFAILAVTGSNLNHLLNNSAAPVPAPAVAAPQSPQVYTSPAGEPESAEAATQYGPEASRSYADLVDPEDIESLEPVEILKDLGIIEGSSHGGQGTAPASVSTPAPAAAEPSSAPTETPNTGIMPITTGMPVEPPVIPTEEPLPAESPAPQDSPAPTEEPVVPPTPEVPLSVGEITFYLTELPLPAFLAEIGVPEPEEGVENYRLDLTEVEYQIIELQFVANDLEYFSVTEGTGFSPNGTVGTVNIIYAVELPQPSDEPETP